MQLPAPTHTLTLFIGDHSVGMVHPVFQRKTQRQHFTSFALAKPCTAPTHTAAEHRMRSRNSMSCMLDSSRAHVCTHTNAYDLQMCEHDATLHPLASLHLYIVRLCVIYISHFVYHTTVWVSCTICFGVCHTFCFLASRSLALSPSVPEGVQITYERYTKNYGIHDFNVHTRATTTTTAGFA